MPLAVRAGTQGEHERVVSELVAIPGDLNSELGCPGDWQPECGNTGLAYDESDGVWQGLFPIPAGSWARRTWGS